MKFSELSVNDHFFFPNGVFPKTKVDQTHYIGWNILWQKDIHPNTEVIKAHWNSKNSEYEPNEDNLPDSLNHLDDIDEDLMDFASRWIEWGEYVTLEFDTDKETCIIEKVERSPYGC